MLDIKDSVHSKSNPTHLTLNVCSFMYLNAFSSTDFFLKLGKFLEAYTDLKKVLGVLTMVNLNIYY